MYAKSYKELVVWQKSILLVKEIYKVSNKLPTEEIYGLTSQMRRSAISIPSNIAEGYNRKGINEYLQFLNIAKASAAELETQIIIAKDVYSNLSWINSETLLNEIQKILSVFIAKLNAKR